MKTLTAVLLVSLLSLHVYAGQPEVQEKSPAAQLAEVKTFGFGLVALSGTARGHVLLKQVLKEEDALKTLMKIYNEGTPEAKLYALSAFHVIAPELFEICRKDIVGHYNPMVHEWEGCLSSEISFLGPLIRINKGEFDNYIKDHKPANQDSNGDSP